MAVFFLALYIFKKKIVYMLFHFPLFIFSFIFYFCIFSVFGEQAGPAELAEQLRQAPALEGLPSGANWGYSAFLKAVNAGRIRKVNPLSMVPYGNGDIHLIHEDFHT